MLLPMSELISSYGVRPRGILHVGAHHAEELESYVESGISRVIWVEADPNVYQTLLERIRPFPQQQAFQFAAQDRDGGFVDLNVMNATMSSSILYPKEHLAFYPAITMAETIRVPAGTLDALFAEQDLPPEEYNFLNMDIQGAELMALRGLEKNLGYFDYVYTEVNESELYEGCCLTSDLDRYLGERGFKRIATSMTPDNWGDALYVRA